MRLMIDLDGVVADFLFGFTTIGYNLGFCTAPWSGKQQTHWSPIFTTERDEQVWKHLQGSYNWWMSLAPIVDGRDINRLNAVITAHDVYFITARVQTKGLPAELQSRYWLDSIGVDTRRAHVIATKHNKGVLCRALDITIGIDDSVPNLASLHENGIEAVAMARYYNIEWSHRAHHLAEFLERVI